MSVNQYKPFIAAFMAASLLILLTIVLPVFFKTWFVYASGNLKVLPVFGPLLALALLLRWPVRPVLLLVSAIGWCFSLFNLVRAEAAFQAGYTLLLVLHTFLICLLLSTSLKQYLARPKLREDGVK